MANLEQLVAEVLHEAADALTNKPQAPSVRVGVTLPGSEHGLQEVLRGAEMAQAKLSGIQVIVIGPESIPTSLRHVAAADETEAHARMEELLSAKEIDAAVTMHYPFPIGVTTIGWISTPGRGKSMFLASTTGTSATDRTQSLVLNTIYGIAVAKAAGIPCPSVGLLNIDGARQAERVLQALVQSGYPLVMAASGRAEGGLMRGNDLLTGTPDVMVADTLTGNVLVKVMSAYTTGGTYEAAGFGYGPGVGSGYHKIINIISRASGSPVIANAIEYAALMAKNKLPALVGKELALAKTAGLDHMLLAKDAPPQTPVCLPPKKTVTAEISGIDVLELENAQQLLGQNGIYAETGMGCTGPIILVAAEDYEKAVELLSQINR